MRPLFAVAIFVSGVLALAAVRLISDTETTVRKHKLEPEARQQLRQQQEPQQLEPQQQQRPQPVEAAKLDLPSTVVPKRSRELGTRDGTGSDSPNKTDQIKIKYTVPSNTTHRRIYERLKEERALETLREFLSPFRLPRKLTVTLEECDGDPNASYEDDSISICYEYIDELWKRGPTDSTTKTDAAPIDAIIGPLFDTALHEFAHALFDMHKLPVFGREEDAADQVAAYITLHLNKAEARRLILGTAYAYKNEIAAEKRPRTTRQFANVHSTPAQRLYNLLCLAYGFDSKVFSDLVGKNFLPKSRAEDCEDEYKQVERAYETLIGPFIDRELERKVMTKRWLPDASTRVQPRTSRQGQVRPPPASQTVRKLKSPAPIAQEQARRHPSSLHSAAIATTAASAGGRAALAPAARSGPE